MDGPPAPRRRAPRAGAPRCRAAALEAEEQIRIEELAALGELRSAVKGALSRLLRSTPSGGKAWVVPVPNVVGRLGASCGPVGKSA